MASAPAFQAGNAGSIPVVRFDKTPINIYYQVFIGVFLCIYFPVSL